MADQGNQNPSSQNKGGQQQSQQGNMPNKQNPQQPTSVKSGQGSGTGSGNR